MKHSEYLKKLSKGKGLHAPCSGLCGNFYSQFGVHLNDEMYKHGICYKNWPQFSGTDDFPVPGYGTLNHYDRYWETTYTMYSRFTRYGRSRRALAKWLSKQFAEKGL